MIRYCAYAAGLSILLFGQGLSAGLLTVPAAQQNASGGLGGVTPFSFSTSAGVHTQIVYEASIFSSLSGQQEITSISFRPIDPAGGIFGNTLSISDVTLSLSTTMNGELNNPLSATFADNIGTDSQVVFAGALTLTTAGAGGGPTGPFDYTITFQTPFIYDPSMGNLLLDTVVNPGQSVQGNGFFGSFPRFDTVENPTDGVASVSNTNLSLNPTMGFVSGAAPVTQFELSAVGTTAVPEPSTYALLGLGSLIVLLVKRSPLVRVVG